MRWRGAVLALLLSGAATSALAQAAPPSARRAQDPPDTAPPSARRADQPEASAGPQASTAQDPVAETLATLGNQQFERGDFEAALHSYRRAEAALPAPASPAVVAELRYRQGRALLALRRAAEAATVLRQSLALLRPLGQSAALGATLQALADAVAAGDDPAAALALYDQALQQRRAAGDVGAQVRTLINAAQLHAQLGEWARGLARLDQAQELARGAAPGTLRAADRARLASSVGLLRALVGQHDAAVVAFEASAQASRDAGDAAGVAESLRNLAFVQLERGQPEDAQRLFLQSVQVLPGDAQVAIALGLNGAGYALVRQERAAQALPLLNDALARLRSSQGTSQELARTLESLGSAHLQLGEYDAARSHLLHSLALARHARSPDDEREALISLGRLALAQGQPALAIVQLKLAVNVSQQLRRGAATLDRASRGTLAQRLALPYKMLARLLIAEKRLLEGEQVLFALKDAEFDEYTRGDAAAATASVPLTAEEQAALSQINELSQRLASVYRQFDDDVRTRVTLSAAQRSELQEREAELLAQLAAALATVDDRLAARRAVALRPAIEELGLSSKAAALSAHALGESTAVLMYVPDERITTVLIAGATGARVVQLPVGLATLSPLIAALRTAIIERGDYQPAARTLHQLIVEPIERELENAATPATMWMLFLTDELRYLPMAALIDAQGRHLVEKVRLAQLVTSTVGQLLEAPRDWTVSAFGSTQAAPAYQLHALPAARMEVRSLVRSADNPQGLLPGRAFVDEQFTRQAWQSVFGRPGAPPPPVTVVHVASHFKALPGDWSNSFLLLGGSEEFRVSELRSALNLSLGHLDLLTLSACATEINAQAAGRELEGFGTLLLKRGARAVIGTLWSVQDEGTAVLMRAFYGARGEQRRLSKAAALQQAQRALLQGQLRSANPALDLRHPYYWAPFVLMGNWL